MAAEVLLAAIRKEKYKIRLIHVLFYFHKISDVLLLPKVLSSTVKFFTNRIILKIM